MKTTAGVELSEKLIALVETMNEAERANYRLFLGMAAGGLAPKGHRPQSELEVSAFSTTIASISKLQPYRHRIPHNGVVYRGRPDFLTDELLCALQNESANLRNIAVRFDDHFVVSGAPLARDIGFSTELYELLQNHAGYVIPTSRPNYIYYDDVGLGIDAHIDDELFPINAILMLQHVYDTNPSALVLYPPHAEVERIILSPGEMIVLYSGSVTHARERMGKGERLSIVGFGFQPTMLSKEC